MSILYFMIGVSLLMALGFLSAFVWSMRTGQQDDLYTPALRILLDDTAPPDTNTTLPLAESTAEQTLQTPDFSNRQLAKKSAISV